MTLAAGYWSQHGTHTVVLLAPVLAFALVGLVADTRAWLRGRRLDPAVTLAAAAAVVAAGVHVTVCPEHYAEGWMYGVFFTVTAGAQLLWAVLLAVRPEPRVVRAGLVASLAVVALWAVTRSVGIPLGPERGEVETIGALDVVATTAELVAAAACVWVLSRSGRQDHRRAVTE
jgi:hypothetical protein